VAIDDVMSHVLWIGYVFLAQAHNIHVTIIYENKQDTQRVMFLHN